MREITIVSGKGGTGKTSLTAAFAALAEQAVICDLDVDAPDLHLLLNPVIAETHPFIAGREAAIDPDRCSACGVCLDRCRFDAVRRDGVGFSIVEALCEGCGVCARFCPAGAIEMTPRTAGRWFRSRVSTGPMLHAELFAGAENSGLLVSTLRREARAAAESEGRNLILSDGPPGIGCPVISSLTGTTLAVIVTEPTPSGRHDLERIADLCRHFDRPAVVVINKADLNAGVVASVEAFCDERGYPVIARVPFCPAIVDALVAGRRLTDVTDDGVADIVRSAWAAVRDAVAALPQT